MLIITLAQDLSKVTESVVEAGLKDPTTRAIIVISTVALFAFVIHLKWFRPSKLKELEIKSTIESARATQTINIRDTAATQERSVVAAARVLELSVRHLDELAKVGRERPPS